MAGIKTWQLERDEIKRYDKSYFELDMESIFANMLKVREAVKYYLADFLR